ncbi:MAG: hypothetical protein LBH76_02165, partial [Propionibacteriaceae bacterium]|nr:hypothetical protein [Propionibacteriaceae bacterium]
LAGFGLTFRPIHRQLRARAGIDDAVARVLATWGGPARLDEAAAKARSAADVYTSVGAAVDAAHAHWLIGRLAVTKGEPAAALDDLRLAVRLFEETGRRERPAYRAAAKDLAAALRAVGHDDEADTLVKALAADGADTAPEDLTD